MINTDIQYPENSMRYREIVNEYILKGDVDPQGITYAYVYKDKYALEVPEIIRSISINVPSKIIDKIIEILAGNEKYNNSYGSWKPILIPYAEQIKTAILKDAELNLQNVSAEVKEIFLNNFKQQTAEGLLGQIMSGLEYSGEQDARITNRQDAKRVLSNPQLLQQKHDSMVTMYRPTSYLIIDHDKKTISRVDKSAEHSTRMSGYKRGSTEYILIRADFSIDPKSMLKLSRDLLKKYPNYTVQEKTPEVMDINRKMQAIFNGRGNIKVYHGTSNAIYKKIQKQKKMIAGQGPDYTDKIQGHSERMIYFTLDPNVARRYAIRAAKSNNYVILEVTLHDLSKLRFDEDSLAGAVNMFNSSTRKNDLAVKKLFPEGWYDSDGSPLKELYQVYEVVISTFNPDTEIDFPNKQKIANYLLYRALITMSETSFAYEGNVPAKDIEVYEVSKTRKADPIGDTEQDYADVEKAAVAGQRRNSR